MVGHFLDCHGSFGLPARSVPVFAESPFLSIDPIPKGLTVLRFEETMTGLHRS